MLLFCAPLRAVRFSVLGFHTRLDSDPLLAKTALSVLREEAYRHRDRLKEAERFRRSFSGARI